MNKTPDAASPEAPSEPWTLGLQNLACGYRRRSLSPVEVVNGLLDAIARDDGRINAFVLLDRDRAVAAARAAEARFAAGTPLDLLDGVPISVKDLTAVQGWPTRRGSAATAGEPPAAEDAPAVALLRAAGAVIFGKTTTSEFGWAAISQSPHTGVTQNPVGPGHTAGGSSCGAAAQIAMGWGPVALATDAGGSIRIPASYCGVVGFKPTYGTIPQAPLGAFGDLSHLGALARSVDDCAAATAVMAQPDRRDPTSLFPRMAATQHPRPRVGWALRLGEQTGDAAPEVARALRGTADRLAGDGYEVREVSFQGLDMGAAFWTLWKARLFESFVDWPAERQALLSPFLQRLMAAGRALDVELLMRSRQTLRQGVARLIAAFSEIDVLLTPATPDGAFLAGDLAPRSHPALAEIQATGNWLAANPYAYPFNLTGQPALVLPLGKTADGLPFGLQIVGHKYADQAVLDLGRSIESA